jgi:uncharacterized protein YkwD
MAGQIGGGALEERGRNKAFIQLKFFVKLRLVKTVEPVMNKLFKIAITSLVLFCGTNARAQQSSGSAAFKKDFLTYINDIRKKGCTCGITYMPPVSPLSWNQQLESAAMGHATDMAQKNYFSHTSKDGRTMENRIAAAGYTYNGFKSYAVGENIAQGQLSIDEVMRGWFKSEGHCKNLMNHAFKEVGVALNDTYWVQDFGGRESFTPEQEKLIKSGKYHLIQKQ